MTSFWVSAVTCSNALLQTLNTLSVCSARLMLVNAAVKKEDYKQIIKVCEPGIEATPDALALYYYLAIAFIRQNRRIVY